MLQLGSLGALASATAATELPICCAHRREAEGLGALMKDDLLVLLVDDREGEFRTLEQTLHSAGIRTQRVHTCSEARAALREPRPSRLILTATALADGTWADVLNLASMHGRAVPVIVVSRFVDVGLYLKTLESGASDFIVPPFSADDLACVVRTAIAKSTSA